MPIKNRNLAILGGAIALIGVVFWAYWNMVYSPAQKLMAVDRKTIVELNEKLNAAKSRAGQLNRIQAEMASLQVDVAELEKLLPKGRELPSLIRVLTHRVEVHGLTLSSFAPQKIVAKGLYDEIGYSISVTSTFHNIGHFLTAMGKGDRLFAARNLAFTGAGSKGDPGKTVNATFQLIAFKYHE